MYKCAIILIETASVQMEKMVKYRNRQEVIQESITIYMFHTFIIIFHIS